LSARSTATPLVIESPWDFLRPSNLLQGLPFAATLLGILAAHEFGHYFAARYHKVAVTLPYFIPMPLTFGTLGAFIQLKEPVPDRRKLFDIGVAGPLAGLVLAVPLLFYRPGHPARCRAAADRRR
jgi:membrane-associated protease RseP (regulator of RpoE activity)